MNIGLRSVLSILGMGGALSQPKPYRTFAEDQALKGRRAARWFRRGENVPSNSRQSRRYRLRQEAKKAVNEANLREVHHKFFKLKQGSLSSRKTDGHNRGVWSWEKRYITVGMPRAERRKLAQAYFVGEWNTTHKVEV